MDIDPSGEPLREQDLDAAGEDVAAGGVPSRERVLDAAARVFAAEGLDAPMPAVAAAAGVGVGTIYRAFGSKEELVAALAADRVEWFGERARAALESPDAWQAFVDLLALTADRQAEDYVVTEALSSIFDHPRVVAVQQSAAASVRELMDRAKAEGRLRPDFTPQDLQMLFAALGAAQQSSPRGSRAWRRLFGMLIDGLNADGASDLGEPALTPEDIGRAARERRQRHGH
jgi:AcrR family transcriptional regulator